jgi:hypothetical protein
LIAPEFARSETLLGLVCTALFERLDNQVRQSDESARGARLGIRSDYGGFLIGGGRVDNESTKPCSDNVAYQIPNPDPRSGALVSRLCACPR